VVLPLAPGAALDDATAIVTTPAAANECRVQNNTTSAHLAIATASDPAELVDEQTFFINVADVNEPPVIITQSLPLLRLRSPYTAAITVSDSDFGDGHRYALLQAPAGVFINARSGLIGYALAQLQRGTYTIEVSATDLRGAVARKTLSLRVVRDVAPVITSTPPVLQLLHGQAYRYNVIASDEDGDAISYSLKG
jgi:hypothetical protein